MKTKVKFFHKDPGRQCCPASNLKNVLLAVVFATVTLNVHAINKNVFKSDTSEIDTYKLAEEPEMELQAWMLDADLFRDFVMDRDAGHHPCNHITKVEEEEELPLETWMLVKELFLIKLNNARNAGTSVADWKTVK